MMRTSRSWALALGAACLVSGSPLRSAEAASAYGGDDGPAEVDVSRYPMDMRENYEVFAAKCASCHTLARPINQSYALVEEWAACVGRMRRKEHSGIDEDSARRIIDFLAYDASVRKKDLIAGRLKELAQEEAADRRTYPLVANTAYGRAAAMAAGTASLTGGYDGAAGSGGPVDAANHRLSPIKAWISRDLPAARRGEIQIRGDWLASTAVFAIPQSVLLARSLVAQAKARRRWSLATLDKDVQSTPRWDGNPAYMNFLLHPYKDGNAYLLYRENGGSPLLSSLFGTYEAFVWEYFGEGWYVPPSRTDLLTGLVSPFIYGETVYQLTRLMEKNGMSLPEKIITTVINPFYAVNRGFRFNSGRKLPDYSR